MSSRLTVRAMLTTRPHDIATVARTIDPVLEEGGPEAVRPTVLILHDTRLHSRHIGVLLHVIVFTARTRTDGDQKTESENLSQRNISIHQAAYYRIA